MRTGNVSVPRGIVTSSPRRAAARLRQRRPWLLLPAMFLPVGVGAFLFTRWRLSRSRRPVAEDPIVVSVETPLVVTPDLAFVVPPRETSVEPVAAVQPAEPPDGRIENPAPASRREPPEGAPGLEPSPGPRVRDLMQEAPEAVEYDAFVTITEARMRELGVDALPVVADGNLAGIVTRGDLAQSMVEGEPRPERDRVADYMTETPVTIAPDASPDEASRLMIARGIHHLVVVEGTRPVGVFSRERAGAEREPSGSGERSL